MESMVMSITDPTIMPRKPPVSHGFHGPESVRLAMFATPDAPETMLREDIVYGRGRSSILKVRMTDHQPTHPPELSHNSKSGGLHITGKQAHVRKPGPITGRSSARRSTGRPGRGRGHWRTDERPGNGDQGRHGLGKSRPRRAA